MRADVLDVWSERLAARVAPDEIDIAPDVFRAYAAGGSRRRALFAPPRADPGAFGAGLAVVLPVIAAALESCATAICDFLAQDAVNTTVATAGLLVALRQLRQGRSAGAETAHRSEPPAVEEAPPEVVEGAAASLGALAARLQESVATADRAEAMAAEVLAELARDPAGAAQFLAVLRERDR